VLKGNELPAMPSNDRIMVLRDPPETKTITSLVIPDSAQVRANTGTIIHAGLKARDIMFDHGHELGDHVWYGKFAGVWQEWKHITKPGKDPKCEHAGDVWSRAQEYSGDRRAGYRCDTCGAVMVQEEVAVMNIEDILCNEDLEARLRSGEMEVHRDSRDGKTTHFIVRMSVKETKNAA
jgi:co-chaperonin GroES (HSP10)